MKKVVTFISLLVVSFMPMAALAIDIPATTPPPGIRSFEGILGVMNTIIDWLFTALMVFAVIMIIYAAFSYLTAGGDEEKISKAHKTIVYAVVAIAVAFLSRGISFVVQQLLGQG